MTLHKFLSMTDYEQKKYLKFIQEIADNNPESAFVSTETKPKKQGYYPVIEQYGRFKSSRKRGVARWNGVAWADCYNNERTTSGRYSTWDAIAWIDC